MGPNDWIAISSGATVVLVLVTGIYVYFTHKLIREQFRPEVYVFFISKNATLHLVIANYGKRPAINVSAEFIPELDKKLFHEKLHDTKRLLTQTILMPEQIFEVPIIFNRDILHDPDFDKIQFEYNVKVKYSEPKGKSFTATYRLNINDFYFSSKVGSYDSKYYFQKIHADLEAINETLKSK